MLKFIVNTGVKIPDRLKYKKRMHAIFLCDCGDVVELEKRAVSRKIIIQCNNCNSGINSSCDIKTYKSYELVDILSIDMSKEEYDRNRDRSRIVNIKLLELGYLDREYLDEENRTYKSVLTKKSLDNGFGHLDIQGKIVWTQKMYDTLKAMQ
jgi:hypothetical protein